MEANEIKPVYYSDFNRDGRIDRVIDRGDTRPYEIEYKQADGEFNINDPTMINRRVSYRFAEGANSRAIITGQGCADNFLPSSRDYRGRITDGYRVLAARYFLKGDNPRLPTAPVPREDLKFLKKASN